MSSTTSAIDIPASNMQERRLSSFLSLSPDQGVPAKPALPTADKTTALSTDTPTAVASKASLTDAPAFIAPTTDSMGRKASTDSTVSTASTAATDGGLRFLKLGHAHHEDLHLGDWAPE